MGEELKIFNPKEKPFGQLSNNFKYYMELDSKLWNTVTDYIYANLLSTTAGKEAVRGSAVAFKHQNIDMEDNDDKKYLSYAQKTYIKWEKKEEQSTVLKSLNTGLDIMLQNRPETAELLINTGNAPIYYVRSNPFLGTGDDGSGDNNYGKMLMQKRHELMLKSIQKKKETENEEKQQNIYKTYIVYEALLNAIKEGNDLYQFLDLTISQMLDELKETYPSFFYKMPNREAVIDLVYRQQPQYILKYSEYPNNMILEIRKQNLEKLRERQIKKRNEIVFDMYADYLLAKHYKTIDKSEYSKAKQQEFSNISWQDKNILEKRLYTCYKKGKLSERLSNSIDEIIENINIPTENEVKIAKNMEIIYQPKLNPENIHYVKLAGQPIYVYAFDTNEVPEIYKQYVPLSPFSERQQGYLNIVGKLYKNIMQYLYTKLIYEVPGEQYKSMTNAYNLITVPGVYPPVFLAVNDIIRRFEEYKQETKINNLRKYATIGLDKKFVNRNMQDILLLTENRKLIWNDFSESVLGVGDDKKGYNFVGKYLMVLRDKIRESRKFEKLDKLGTVDINILMERNNILYKWLQMRVNDMCKVIMIMKNYTKNINLTPDFVKHVLDDIYQPCSSIYASVDKINVEIPYFFVNMVTQCEGFSNSDRKIIDILWERTAVILYYLNEYAINKENGNIESALKQIDDILSKKQKCIKIVNNREDNCIMSAIINILNGIITFNKYFIHKVKNIGINEINTAASIIVGGNIKLVEDNNDEDDKDDEEDEEDEEDENIEKVDDIIAFMKKEQEKQEKEQRKRQIQKQENIEISNEDFFTGYDKDEFKYIYKDELKSIDNQEEDDTEDHTYSEDQIYVDDRTYSDGEHVPEFDEDGFAPVLNNLISTLELMDIYHPEKVAKMIEDVVEIIKEYPISRKIKENRINFFATIKN